MKNLHMVVLFVFGLAFASAANADTYVAINQSQYLPGDQMSISCGYEDLTEQGEKKDPIDIYFVIVKDETFSFQSLQYVGSESNLQHTVQLVEGVVPYITNWKPETGDYNLGVAKVSEGIRGSYTLWMVCVKSGMDPTASDNQVAVRNLSFQVLPTWEMETLFESSQVVCGSDKQLVGKIKITARKETVLNELAVHLSQELGQSTSISRIYLGDDNGDIFASTDVVGDRVFFSGLDLVVNGSRTISVYVDTYPIGKDEVGQPMNDCSMDFFISEASDYQTGLAVNPQVMATIGPFSILPFQVQAEFVYYAEDYSTEGHLVGGENNLAILKLDIYGSDKNTAYDGSQLTLALENIEWEIRTNAWVDDITIEVIDGYHGAHGIDYFDPTGNAGIAIFHFSEGEVLASSEVTTFYLLMRGDVVTPYDSNTEFYTEIDLGSSLQFVTNEGDAYYDWGNEIIKSPTVMNESSQEPNLFVPEVSDN